jgi:uncharacterized protein DUF6817
MKCVLSAQSQHMLDKYLLPDQQYLFYENCTTSEQATFFQGYLSGHLMDTARILETWGCEKDLCCAGLFHSLYSTEGLASVDAPFVPLPLERREEVRVLLGWRTERLVYLFSALERRTFFEHGVEQSAFTLFDRFNHVEIPLSRQEYADLLTLTLADWLEPVVGKRVHPQVEEYVRASYKEEFVQLSSFLCTQAMKDFRLVYEIEQHSVETKEQ